MADFVQGRVELIHTVSASKPTETKPTNTSDSVDIDETNNPKPTKELIEKGAKQVMGATSLKRRLANTAMNNVNTLVSWGFDHYSHKQNIIGNSRGAAKISNIKSTYVSIVNMTKSGVGAGITARSLKNPAILYVWAAGEALKMGENFINYKHELYYYNERKSMDESASLYQRNRLQRNTLGRRR